MLEIVLQLDLYPASMEETQDDADEQCIWRDNQVRSGEPTLQPEILRGTIVWPCAMPQYS